MNNPDNNEQRIVSGSIAQTLDIPVNKQPTVIAEGSLDRLAHEMEVSADNLPTGEYEARRAQLVAMGRGNLSGVIPCDEFGKPYPSIQVDSWSEFEEPAIESKVIPQESASTGYILMADDQGLPVNATPTQTGGYVRAELPEIPKIPKIGNFKNNMFTLDNVMYPGDVIVGWAERSCPIRWCNTTDVDFAQTNYMPCHPPISTSKPIPGVVALRRKNGQLILICGHIPDIRVEAFKAYVVNENQLTGSGTLAQAIRFSTGIMTPELMSSMQEVIKLGGNAAAKKLGSKKSSKNAKKATHRF